MFCTYKSLLVFDKLNCGFFHSLFALRKNTPQNNFSLQKNLYKLSGKIWLNNFFCCIFLLTSKSQHYTCTKHRIISYIEPSLIVILNISRTILLFLPEPYDFLALLKTTTGKFFCHSDFGFAGQDCNLAETLLKFSSKSVTLMTPEPNFVWSL